MIHASFQDQWAAFIGILKELRTTNDDAQVYGTLRTVMRLYTNQHLLDDDEGDDGIFHHHVGQVQEPIGPPPPLK